MGLSSSAPHGTLPLRGCPPSLGMRGCPPSLGKRRGGLLADGRMRPLAPRRARAAAGWAGSVHLPPLDGSGQPGPARERRLPARLSQRMQTAASPSPSCPTWLATKRRQPGRLLSGTIVPERPACSNLARPVTGLLPHVVKGTMRQPACCAENNCSCRAGSRRLPSHVWMLRQRHKLGALLRCT
jgi:hypothetical protein